MANPSGEASASPAGGLASIAGVFFISIFGNVTVMSISASPSGADILPSTVAGCPNTLPFAERLNSVGSVTAPSSRTALPAKSISPRTAPAIRVRISNLFRRPPIPESRNVKGSIRHRVSLPPSSSRIRLSFASWMERTFSATETGSAPRARAGSSIFASRVAICVAEWVPSRYLRNRTSGRRRMNFVNSALPANRGAIAIRTSTSGTARKFSPGWPGSPETERFVSLMPIAGNRERESREKATLRPVFSSITETTRDFMNSRETSLGRTTARRATARTITAAMTATFRMVPSYPSVFLSTSCTILGLAFPRVSFITCPTKKERRPAFPPR